MALIRVFESQMDILIGISMPLIFRKATGKSMERRCEFHLSSEFPFYVRVLMTFIGKILHLLVSLNKNSRPQVFQETKTMFVITVKN